MKLYSQTRTEKTRMQDYYWSVTSSIRLEIRVQMLLNETNMCIFNNLPEAVHVDRWSWLVFSLRIMHEANLSTHVQSMKSCTSFDKWPATIKPCYWQQQQQPFNGRLSGTTRVGQYQKKHSPDHTHPGQRTSFITFLHLQRSMASSLFSLCAWQSSRTTSLQVLFGPPLGLEPSTSHCMHFFTQSSSSFRSTCPYQRSLFCCNINAMSSTPSLSLSSLLGSLSFSIMPHIHHMHETVDKMTCPSIDNIHEK